MVEAHKNTARAWTSLTACVSASMISTPVARPLSSTKMRETMACVRIDKFPVAAARDKVVAGLEAQFVERHQQAVELLGIDRFVGQIGVDLRERQKPLLSPCFN